MTTSPGRTGAEWVTFVVSSVVLLVVAGLLVAQLFGTDGPARPVAVVAEPVREQDGRFVVAVEVSNEGDDAASEVQVVAELTIGGRTSTGDQIIALLGGGESEELRFVFEDDPAGGELTVGVSGFAVP